MINISCDLGYGMIIAKSKEREIMINNLITEIEDDKVDMIREMLNDEDEENVFIKHEGKYYILGEMSARVSNIKRYLSNDVTSVYRMVQTLGSIALLSNSEQIETNIILGLPNKLAYKKEQLSESMLGIYEIDIIKKENIIHKTISIENCLTIEQPLSPIFNLKMNGIRKYNILSLDVGHNTADTTVLRKGVKSTSPREWVCVDGVKYCYELIEQELIKKFRDYGIMSIEELTLQETIESGLFKFKSQIIDVTEEIVNPILKKYAQYIYHEIENAYSDFLAKADIIILSGGIGANRTFINELSQLLSAYKVVFKVLDSPQKAICTGMFNIINSKYREVTVND